jgi:hypothetical protein
VIEEHSPEHVHESDLSHLIVSNPVFVFAFAFFVAYSSQDQTKERSNSGTTNKMKEQINK